MIFLGLHILTRKQFHHRINDELVQQQKLHLREIEELESEHQKRVRLNMAEIKRLLADNHDLRVKLGSKS